MGTIQKAELDEVSCYPLQSERAGTGLVDATAGPLVLRVAAMKGVPCWFQNLPSSLPGTAAVEA